MPQWGAAYYLELVSRCDGLAAGLGNRIEDIVHGRVAPAVDDLTIGSARKIGSAILFFDIRNFTSWSGDPSDAGLKRALVMLDLVIPMMMHVLHDFDAYVEKNTGDGVMAIFPDGPDAASAVNRALTASTVMFHVLHTIVNPKLVTLGLWPIEARIGIDYGHSLIARIGVPSGSARFGRNGLVAVGPAAIIACRLQQQAGTNQIWIGHMVYTLTTELRRSYCRACTPAEWKWHQQGHPTLPYWAWQYAAVMRNPFTMA